MIRLGPVPLAAILALTGCSATTSTRGMSPGEFTDDYLVTLAGAVAPVASYDAATLGTKVRWEGDPERARARARQEQKLLLVLHLSGEFESFEST